MRFIKRFFLLVTFFIFPHLIFAAEFLEIDGDWITVEPVSGGEDPVYFGMTIFRTNIGYACYFKFGKVDEYMRFVHFGTTKVKTKDLVVHDDSVSFVASPFTNVPNEDIRFNLELTDEMFVGTMHEVNRPHQLMQIRFRRQSDKILSKSDPVIDFDEINKLFPVGSDFSDFQEYLVQNKIPYNLYYPPDDIPGYTPYPVVFKDMAFVVELIYTEYYPDNYYGSPILYLIFSKDNTAVYSGGFCYP